MFTLKKWRNMYHVLMNGNKDFRVDGHSVEIVSDIIQLSDKQYIRIKAHGTFANFLSNLEEFCSEQFDNYAYNLQNNVLFVKLPFRYRKFEIQFDNCTSNSLSLGKVVNVSLKVNGVISINDKLTLSYSLVALSM